VRDLKGLSRNGGKALPHASYSCLLARIVKLLAILCGEGRPDSLKSGLKKESRKIFCNLL
jgi:hypothetical protein